MAAVKRSRRSLAAELRQGPVQFGVEIATNLLKTTRRDDDGRQRFGAEGAEIQRAFAAGKDLAQDAGIEALALGRVSGDLIAALQRCPVGFGLQMQLRGVHRHGEIDDRRTRAMAFQPPFAGGLAQGKGLLGGDLVDAVAGAKGAGEGGGDGDDLAGSDELDAALPLAQLLDGKGEAGLVALRLDAQAVAEMEAVAALEGDGAVAKGRHFAEKAAGGAGGVRRDDVARRAAGEETLGRRPAEGEFELLLGGGDDLRPLLLLGIEDGAISTDDVRHILGALHPPFDLQAADPRRCQFGEEVDGGEVVGGEPVAVLLLAVTVATPAGLGATAAVAALAAEPGGEVALPGEAEAEGAVDEVFELDGGGAADGGDLGQRQFAGEDGAGKAELLQHLHPGDIVHGQLRRGVEFEIGEVLLGEAPDCEILDDDAVDAQGIEISQGLDQAGKFLLLDQGVEGDVDAPVMGVCPAQHPFQLGQGDVLGLGAGGELLEAEVNGIGAILHGGKEGFEAAGRGEEFGTLGGRSIHGRKDTMRGRIEATARSFVNLRKVIELLSSTLRHCCVSR